MTAFITVLGFIGAGCFALCTFPQILRVLKRKSTADISLLFILLSLGGNLCSATYIFYTNWVSGYWQIPQYFNYTIATTLVITLLCLKIKYDRAQLAESVKRAVHNFKVRYAQLQYDLYHNREFVIKVVFISLLILAGVLYLGITE